jgi:hypothetical protein
MLIRDKSDQFSSTLDVSYSPHVGWLVSLTLTNS